MLIFINKKLTKPIKQIKSKTIYSIILKGNDDDKAALYFSD